MWKSDNEGNGNGKKTVRRKLLDWILGVYDDICFWLDENVTSRKNVMFAAFVGGGIFLTMGILITNHGYLKVTERVLNDITPGVNSIMSFLTTSTENEYADIVDEIRHSFVLRSFSTDDLEFIDDLENTCQSCPLDQKETFKEPLYLVSLNTGGLYDISALSVGQPPTAEDDKYGFTSISHGFDEVSLTRIRIEKDPDNLYTSVNLSRDYGLTSIHRVKENFCEDCIRQMVEALEFKSVAEVALFDTATHEIMPIVEGERYTGENYTISISRKNDTSRNTNDYIIAIEYTE